MGKRRRLESETAAKRRRIISSSSSEDDIPTRPGIDDTSLHAQVLPTFDSGSNAVEVASNAEETNLDEEILSFLGDSPKDDTVLGKPTHKDIATRWNEILLKGLPKETKEKLLNEYPIPSNCEMLMAPKINAEVKAAVAENICKRDTALTAKQNQIGTALAALSQALDSVLMKDFSHQKLLKPLSDACRILCDSHYTETKTRRYFVMSNINHNMKETMADANRDKYLFGENVAERLKSAKSIKKTGTDLKANKIGPAFRNSKFNKNNFTKYKNRDQPNWKPLQQKTTGAANAGFQTAPNQPRSSGAAAAGAARGGAQHREAVHRPPPPPRQRPPPRRR